MRLFSTDIDGTIFDGPESAERFYGFWSSVQIRPNPPLLVYNTGRAMEDAKALVNESGLPQPDHFICGVGTEISGGSKDRPLDGWCEQLEIGWNFSTVYERVNAQLPVRFQPEECQNPYKCSWFWEKADLGAIEALVGALAAEGLRVQAVYSSDRDLDFLPARANKGNAVSWLAGELGINTADIVVAGDSGNDASMYLVEGVRGVLVANAEASLIEAVANLRPFHASMNCAAGVIQGLQHFLNPKSGGVLEEGVRG